MKCKQCVCNVLEVHDPIAGNYLVCSNQSCQLIQEERHMLPPINQIGIKATEILKSGGTKFETGAVRSSDKNHVMYQLISPIAMRRVAETMKEGFDKYGAYNWEKGMPIGDILNHAIDHIYSYLMNPNPSKREEDDLAHATWNLMAAMHMEETHPHIEHGLRSSPEKAAEVPSEDIKS